MPKKILVDCFIFNNEYKLLTARLNALKGSVDRFLIVESSHSFTGLKKPLKLKQYILEHFSELADRISVFENKHYLSQNQSEYEWAALLPYPICISELKHTLQVAKADTQVWLNDCFQRECLMLLIDQYCDDQAMVIISDVDEIPSASFLNAIKIPSPYALQFAQMEQYRYDIHFKDLSAWIGSVACRKSTVLQEGVNAVRFFTKRGLNHLTHQIHPLAGWHFTSIGSPNEIMDKIYSWGHQELNTPINRRLLNFRIRRGLDIFGRKMAIEYTLHPHIPGVITEVLRQSHVHGYKAPNRLELAFNKIAVLLDKFYRFCKMLVCTHQSQNT